MTRRSAANRPRKKPVQARSKQTLEWILEATTRVFRTEGFDATTNRIAAAAGVSIGSLYEYFPNKDALLLALAERHVALAETGVSAALASPAPLADWLATLQAAIVASHRYPSQALALVSSERAPELRERASQLRQRILAAVLERARTAGRSDPQLRARTAFGLIAEQSSAALFELESAEERDAMLRHLLALAVDHLTA